jgi:hypothetical protein
MRIGEKENKIITFSRKFFGSKIWLFLFLL